MRTSIVCAAFLGLFAVGCAGELSGTGGGDDVQPPEGCGDGATGTGETCDDGNTTSGDGCSSTCQTEQTSTPRVAIAVDKTTVATDLYVDNEVNITLTSMNGFAGDVTLAVAAADNAGTPIMGWTSTLSTTTVSVPAEGTGTAKLAVRIPGDTANLTGNIKVTATSTAAAVDTTVAVNATTKAIITYTTSGENCVYPTNFNIANPVRLKVGRTLSIKNAGPAAGSPNRQMQIHIDGGTPGVAHQNAPMAVNASYDQTPTANNTGATVTFYCHNANQPGVVAVELQGGAARQRLIVVD